MSRHHAAIENAQAKLGRSGKSQTQAKSNGNRSPSQARYVNERRWETNQRRRVLRHARRHTDDRQAFEWCKANMNEQEFKLATTLIGSAVVFEIQHPKTPRGSARAKKRETSLAWKARRAAKDGGTETIVEVA